MLKATKLTVLGATVLTSALLLTGCSPLGNINKAGTSSDSSSNSSTKEVTGTASEKLYTILQNSGKEIDAKGITEETTKSGETIGFAYSPEQDKSVMFTSKVSQSGVGTTYTLLKKLTVAPSAEALGDVTESNGAYTITAGGATSTIKTKDGLVSEYTINKDTIKVVKYGLTDAATAAFSNAK